MSKRKANRGSFKPGDDPRRHQLTQEERRRGYATARANGNIHIAAWVWRRVRGYYRRLKREPT